MASYTESFLWASQEKLKQMVVNLDNRRYSDNPTLSLEHIEDMAGTITESLEFLQSAVVGLKDMVKMTVDRIGEKGYLVGFHQQEST